MKTGRVKINSILKDGIRLDALCQLSDGHMAYRMVMNCPCKILTLKDITLDIFNAERWKRVYVNDEVHGYRFIGSSSMLQADMNNVKYISRKYTVKPEAKAIKKGMTLVSCSGTIGNTVFANAKHAGTLASQHVIRLLPNNILGPGYIYAYLTTKYGYALLTQGTYGGVIRHIEPVHIKNMPIPVFSDEFVNEVDSLIQTSARLREEAADAIVAAHKLIEDNIPLSCSRRAGTTSIKRILQSHNHRFEASYYQTDNRSIYDYIIQNYTYKTLYQLTTDIFRPGIFKRKFVESDGIMFLGGADIMMAIPNSEKMLSKSQVKEMPELMPKEGWILATCGGTIGKTVYVDKQLATCAVSQHVMRIVPNGELPNGYLYAFLSSNIGYKLLTLFTYGSVIPQVEPHHLRLIPVPILDEQLMNVIDSLVNEYVHKNEEAKSKESKAIAMVEAEIEKWNK